MVKKNIDLDAALIRYSIPSSGYKPERRERIASASNQHQRGFLNSHAGHCQWACQFQHSLSRLQAFARDRDGHKVLWRNRCLVGFGYRRCQRYKVTVCHGLGTDDRTFRRCHGNIEERVCVSPRSRFIEMCIRGSLVVATFSLCTFDGRIWSMVQKLKNRLDVDLV